MKTKSFILLFFVITITTQSQTIFGKWNSKDDATGKIDSVIEVYEKEGRAFAKVVEITNPKRKNALCKDCEGESKDQPILGLNILTGLEKEGDEWSGGEILDPRNGKVYKCYVRLIKGNKLKLRGYIGISLFGKTAYWERVD
ncbi:hypothetical protein BTO04_04615 [Polaribacter sp. SA4-10]|uniref:DUF2147 domain-containing protein n=1 Tax=Polaribacter sp. SA4-10 TaxID=754397 RepID=UPI000B3C7549|nr:DUF2147 domain-containing protein [Polaribacter sp. SA4-10]ARV06026.1 hypothetical protein BTO04_04615 [Polaribacter sp. SA4-10]